jgi:hypothetical protein
MVSRAGGKNKRAGASESGSSKSGLLGATSGTLRGVDGGDGTAGFGGAGNCESEDVLFDGRGAIR